jgi:hypothetical protein
VGDKDHFRRDVGAAQAMRTLHLGEQSFHHLPDVLHVEAGAVEGAVGSDTAQHLADGADTTLARGVGVLEHEGGSAHTDEHAVTAAVEGDGGVLDHVVGGGGPGGQEACAEPTHELVGGDVVG